MTANAPAGLLLREVVGALSYALDLTEGQPPGHSMRCCYIGMHVGRELGLDQDLASDLYYTLLLKDAGCSSNAARLCELYGGDDRQLKHDVKTVDLQSLRSVGKFVLAHTGVHAGWWSRLKLLWHLARNGERLATEVVQARCERGASIARKLGFGPRVAAGIQSLDEHWNGRGRPSGQSGTEIPLLSRIALLAQVVDVFHRVGGHAAAMAEVQKRSGSWFDPDVVAAFEAAAAQLYFWPRLAAPDLHDLVLDLEPTAVSTPLDDERLDAIAAGFGEVIDAKSPYTSGHSSRVAAYSGAICDVLGLDAERRRWIHRGALLHDLGKLGISNTLLDKPGRLTEGEWAQMRQHPVLTHQILSRLSPFQRLAMVAAAHHERLDGTGYPWGLRHDEIPIETRIITIADIWDAISADRPYRRGMPLAKALDVMESLRGASVDPKCLDALRLALPEVDGSRAHVESVQSLFPAVSAPTDAALANS